MGLVCEMLTNANKGSYLVKNGQKYANVIYERSLNHKVNKALFKLYVLIIMLVRSSLRPIAIARTELSRLMAPDETFVLCHFSSTVGLIFQNIIAM